VARGTGLLGPCGGARRANPAPQPARIGHHPGPRTPTPCPQRRGHIPLVLQH
jgi:hypothetical protein